MAICSHRQACSAARPAARMAMMRRPRVVLARSASVSVSTEQRTDSKVVSLSSGEYEEFLAANADTHVIVDYYTE